MSGHDFFNPLEQPKHRHELFHSQEIVAIKTVFWPFALARRSLESFKPFKGIGISIVILAMLKYTYFLSKDTFIYIYIIMKRYIYIYIT